MPLNPLAGTETGYRLPTTTARRIPPWVLPATDAPSDDMLVRPGPDAAAQEASARGIADAVRVLNEAVALKHRAGADHLIRVASFVGCLGQVYGLDAGLLDSLVAASSLHDIGKIAVPDVLLQKQDRLNDQEAQVLRQHTLQGHRLLSKGTSWTLHLAAEVALNHHERWDGTGYPNQRRSEWIPLSARIVAVADVFDSLLTVRPYRPAWTMDASIGFILEHGGSYFDPQVVRCFSDSIDRLRTIVKRFP